MIHRIILTFGSSHGLNLGTLAFESTLSALVYKKN